MHSPASISVVAMRFVLVVSLYTRVNSRIFAHRILSQPKIRKARAWVMTSNICLPLQSVFCFSSEPPCRGKKSHTHGQCVLLAERNMVFVFIFLLILNPIASTPLGLVGNGCQDMNILTKMSAVSQFIAFYLIHKGRSILICLI